MKILRHIPPAGLGLFLAAGLLFAPPAPAAVTFVFQYDDLTNGLNKGFADTNIVPGTSKTYGEVRREATERAGRLLGALFNHSATSIVDVTSTADPDNLGGCSSSASGASAPGFVRSVTAKKIIEGINEMGDQPDLELSMNFVAPDDPNWDYSDAVEADKMDYVDTLVHEITHALGILNSVGPGGGGLLDVGQGQPQKWLIWDRFLADRQTNALINPATCVFNSSRMDTLTNGTLCFYGTHALRAGNGRPVQIYALPEWSEGSSACHVNTNYSTGTVMYFEGDPGPSSRLYCPSETGMLKDMGYDINDPLAPTNITASQGAYPEKVVLTWAAALTTPAVSNPVAYVIYRNTRRDIDSAVVLADGLAPNRLTYEDTAVTPGTMYFYWVRARYNLLVPQTTLFRDAAAGYAGAQPPAPTAPAAVAVSQGDYGNRARVTWSASAGATRFAIYRHTESNRAGAVALSPEVAEAQFDDTSAAPGVRYYYWVKAGNAAGTSDFSAVASGYRAIHPPTGVTVSKGTVGGKIKIAWTGSVGANAYEVWRGTSLLVTAAALIGTTPATNYDDTTVAMDVTNRYWIKAKNDFCASQFSRSDNGFRKRTRANRGIEGDGVADPWTASNGILYYWPSSLGYARQSVILGVPGTVLMADIDGDWLDDPAVYSAGIWIAWLSGSGYTMMQAATGLADGEPALGYIDEDDLADPAVFNNGIWTAWLSDSGYAPIQAPLGGSGAPLLGDIDGDGLSDPALFENGTWTAWLSDSDYAPIQAPLGGNGVPVLGDFDGDGLADPAINNGGYWTFWLSDDDYQPAGPFPFIAP